jgi:hypothetical protein
MRSETHPIAKGAMSGASLQFVRKIIGCNKPSKANEALFLAAVDELAAISTRLLHSLKPTHRRRTGKKRRPKQSSRCRAIRRRLSLSHRVTLLSA